MDALKIDSSQTMQLMTESFFMPLIKLVIIEAAITLIFYFILRNTPGQVLPALVKFLYIICVLLAAGYWFFNIFLK